MQEFMNAQGEEEMDVENDEYAPTQADVDAEAAESPTIMAHVDMWDRFLEWVRFMQEDWESDTNEYRKGKATALFGTPTHLPGPRRAALGWSDGGGHLEMLKESINWPQRL